LQAVLSEKAADLIGASTYELEIYNFLDSKTAHAQAMEEFASGDLPRKQLPRRRYTDPKPQPERPTAHVAAPELSRPSPASNMHLLATVGADPSPSTVGPKPPIPNNVGPIPTPFNLDNFVGKCFGVSKRHDDVW